MWGQSFVRSTKGSLFFLTIVDDYNQFIWVYLMQNKSQTCPLIQSFFHFIENIVQP
jgi:hypothetical protein